MKVRVLTRFLYGDNETFRTIDYSVREQRKWLANHQTWALSNGRSVSTWAAGTEADNCLMDDGTLAALPRSTKTPKPRKD
jgi:hypothetical protein